MLPGDWRGRAMCRKLPEESPEDVELFFPDPEEEDKSMIREAVEVYCDHCPVRDECLDLGIKTGSQGVWGGYHIPYRLAGTLNNHPLDEIKAILKEES